MRHVLLALVLALSSSASIAGDTVAFGNRVISVGDSIGRVREAAGSPDRIVPLVNGYGAGVGERWEYYRDGKTIMLTMSGGRVIAVDEARD